MSLQNHFRNTMLAGLFAVLPVVVTIAVLIYVGHLTNDPITRLLGFRIPGLGMALGMALGMVVIYFGARSS